MNKTAGRTYYVDCRRTFRTGVPVAKPEKGRKLSVTDALREFFAGQTSASLDAQFPPELEKLIQDWDGGECRRMADYFAKLSRYLERRSIVQGSSRGKRSKLRD